MIAVRCPHDLDPVDALGRRPVGAGQRRWLIERRRINPLIRTLRRTTDPLFRRAGMSPDAEG